MTGAGEWNYSALVYAPQWDGEAWLLLTCPAMVPLATMVADVEAAGLTVLTLVRLDFVAEADDPVVFIH